MSTVLLILAFILGALLAIFGLQNLEPQRVNFLNFSSGEIPLALVIFTSALVGAILTFLIGLRGRIHSSLELRRKERRLRQLEAEVALLRSQQPGSDTSTVPISPSNSPDSDNTVPMS